MNALKEQLLKAGFQIKAPEPVKPVERSAKPVRSETRPSTARHAPAPSRARTGPAAASKATSATGLKSDHEISLAAAYHVRADHERREKEEKQKREAEIAARRKAARARLQALIAAQGIKTEGAERCRHFRYGKKIKRMYLSDEQNAKVNGAELGIVQLDGRFHLLPAEAIREIQVLGAEFVAVFDPKEPSELQDGGSVDYSDPKFQVPDDLVW